MHLIPNTGLVYGSGTVIEILSTKAGMITHVDSFFNPNTAQWSTEYCV